MSATSIPLTCHGQPVTSINFANRIGGGTYGQIYQYGPDELGLVVKKSPTTSPMQLSELDVMSRINHKYIVQGLDFFYPDLWEIPGETQNDLYIVMARYQDSLDHYLYDLQVTKKDSLTPEQCKKIGSQLINAITFLHKNGYYHCDIKPGNILLSPSLDVALSDMNLTHNLNFGNEVCQTDDFASPQRLYRNLLMMWEQADSATVKDYLEETLKVIHDEAKSKMGLDSSGLFDKPSPIADDIWAVGATLLTVVTGTFIYSEEGVTLDIPGGGLLDPALKERVDRIRNWLLMFMLRWSQGIKYNNISVDTFKQFGTEDRIKLKEFFFNCLQFRQEMRKFSFAFFRSLGVQGTFNSIDEDVFPERGVDWINNPVYMKQLRNLVNFLKDSKELNENSRIFILLNTISLMYYIAGNSIGIQNNFVFSPLYYAAYLSLCVTPFPTNDMVLYFVRAEAPEYDGSSDQTIVSQFSDICRGEVCRLRGIITVSKTFTDFLNHAPADMLTTVYEFVTRPSIIEKYSKNIDLSSEFDLYMSSLSEEVEYIAAYDKAPEVAVVDVPEAREQQERFEQLQVFVPRTAVEDMKIAVSKIIDELPQTIAVDKEEMTNAIEGLMNKKKVLSKKKGPSGNPTYDDWISFMHPRGVVLGYYVSTGDGVDLEKFGRVKNLIENAKNNTQQPKIEGISDYDVIRYARLWNLRRSL